MFIREVKKQRSKDSKVFYQYTLAQATRVEGKVKQRAVLYLGSDPLLKDKESRTIVLNILKAKIFNQQELFPSKAPKPLVYLALSYFEKYRIKYGEDTQAGASLPPPVEKAEFHNIDIEGLQVDDVKTFGAEHLCKQVLDKLGLNKFLTSLGMGTKQVKKALISIAARALFCASEHKTAQILQTNSELLNCFKFNEEITHKQLYAISDMLYEAKEKIDHFLYGRVSDMFSLHDKLVIFDISDTYFETRETGSKIARYGRSKEKRNDCPLVVFTGVINAQGFIRHSRIYEGNKADSATLADMIQELEKNTLPGSKPTLVMDAGIATEDNLALVQQKGYRYVCVSPIRLNDYQLDHSVKKTVQLTDREKNKVELAVFHPQDYDDTWLYVQSEAKKAKEQSMDKKLKDRFCEELTAIREGLHKKGGTKKTEKVWERIGRIKERHSRVWSGYEITLVENKGKITGIRWQEKAAKKDKEDKSNGVYFIRTNYKDPTEKELWNIYNTIREVEATFRCLKSDLNIRPVHHQKDQRIEAHIYLTILAYQLVNTIRYMLKKENIHHDWKNITRIMNTQTIQTVVLPTDKKTIHLRKPARPIKEAQQIYNATNCSSTQSAIKKYVVYH